MTSHRNKFTNITTTGFGTQSSQSGRRFYLKDGNVNIKKKGVGYIDRISWFHSLLELPRWQFWMWLCGIYLSINLIFAFIYKLIGIENLSGIEKVSGTPTTQSSHLNDLAEAFFFSVQTFTTVGYGRISPMGMLANSVAAFESFLGLLAFALASGLFYSRFAKPKAHLYFSQNALISPFHEGIALMFRTVPFKNHHLMDGEVKITAAMRSKEGGEEYRNHFYNLEVEVSKVNALVLNWTIVHPINADSPLYGMTIEDMKEANLEILVFLKAYDEGFSNTVVGRTSYNVAEIIEGAKFVPMYHSSARGDKTILNVDKLDVYQKVTLPVLPGAQETLSGAGSNIPEKQPQESGLSLTAPDNL